MSLPSPRRPTSSSTGITSTAFSTEMSGPTNHGNVARWNHQQQHRPAPVTTPKMQRVFGRDAEIEARRMVQLDREAKHTTMPDDQRHTKRILPPRAPMMLKPPPPTRASPQHQVALRDRGEDSFGSVGVPDESDEPQWTGEEWIHTQLQQKQQQQQRGGGGYHSVVTLKTKSAEAIVFDALRDGVSSLCLSADSALASLADWTNAETREEVLRRTKLAMESQYSPRGSRDITTTQLLEEALAGLAQHLPQNAVEDVSLLGVSDARRDASTISAVLPPPLNPSLLQLFAPASSSSSPKSVAATNPKRTSVHPPQLSSSARRRRDIDGGMDLETTSVSQHTDSQGQQAPVPNATRPEPSSSPTTTTDKRRQSTWKLEEALGSKKYASRSQESEDNAMVSSNDAELFDILDAQMHVQNVLNLTRTMPSSAGMLHSERSSLVPASSPPSIKRSPSGVITQLIGHPKSEKSPSASPTRGGVATVTADTASLEAEEELARLIAPQSPSAPTPMSNANLQLVFQAVRSASKQAAINLHNASDTFRKQRSRIIELEAQLLKVRAVAAISSKMSSVPRKNLSPNATTKSLLTPPPLTADDEEFLLLVAFDAAHLLEIELTQAQADAMRSLFRRLSVATVQRTNGALVREDQHGHAFLFSFRTAAEVLAYAHCMQVYSMHLPWRILAERCAATTASTRSTSPSLHSPCMLLQECRVEDVEPRSPMSMGTLPGLGESTLLTGGADRRGSSAKGYASPDDNDDEDDDEDNSSEAANKSAKSNAMTHYERNVLSSTVAQMEEAFRVCVLREIQHCSELVEEAIVAASTASGSFVPQRSGVSNGSGSTNRMPRASSKVNSSDNDSPIRRHPTSPMLDDGKDLQEDIAVLSAMRARCNAAVTQLESGRSGVNDVPPWAVRGPLLRCAIHWGNAVEETRRDRFMPLNRMLQVTSVLASRCRGGSTVMSTTARNRSRKILANMDVQLIPVHNEAIARDDTMDDVTRSEAMLLSRRLNQPTHFELEWDNLSSRHLWQNRRQQQGGRNAATGATVLSPMGLQWPTSSSAGLGKSGLNHRPSSAFGYDTMWWARETLQSLLPNGSRVNYFDSVSEGTQAGGDGGGGGGGGGAKIRAAIKGRRGSETESMAAGGGGGGTNRRRSSAKSGVSLVATTSDSLEPPMPTTDSNEVSISAGVSRSILETTKGSFRVNPPTTTTIVQVIPSSEQNQKSDPLSSGKLKANQNLSFLSSSVLGSRTSNLGGSSPHKDKSGNTPSPHKHRRASVTRGSVSAPSQQNWSRRGETRDADTQTPVRNPSLQLTRFILEACRWMLAWVEGSVDENQLLEYLYDALEISKPSTVHISDGRVENNVLLWGEVTQRAEASVESFQGQFFGENDRAAKAGIVMQFAAIRDLLHEVSLFRRRKSGASPPPYVPGGLRRLSSGDSTTSGERKGGWQTATKMALANPTAALSRKPITTTTANPSPNKNSNGRNSTTPSSPITPSPPHAPVPIVAAVSSSTFLKEATATFLVGLEGNQHRVQSPNHQAASTRDSPSNESTNALSSVVDRFEPEITATFLPVPF